MEAEDEAPTTEDVIQVNDEHINARLDPLLRIKDGRKVLELISKHFDFSSLIHQISKKFFIRGQIHEWRKQLNRWLVLTNQDVEAQRKAAHQEQVTCDIHTLLRRLYDESTPQEEERNRIRTQIQEMAREATLQSQTIEQQATQTARKQRALIHEALRTITRFETAGMDWRSLVQPSHRAARAAAIDRYSLPPLHSLHTDDAPEAEDLIWYDNGPVALCLQAMDTPYHNTSDRALNQPLLVGQLVENQVFEPAIVAMGIADRIETLDFSPLTNQPISVCLPIISLRDEANRQAAFERLCLVFMNGRSMKRVWLIALSSILRTIESKTWANPETTPTGRLLQWFARQIMEHVTLHAGSRLSPVTSQPVNAALVSILSDEVLTVHSTVVEVSVILRLLHRFGGPAPFTIHDLQRSMIARIANYIPQGHLNWLKANSSDVWADQGAMSRSSLLSSVCETTLASSGADHVVTAGSGHMIESLDSLLSPHVVDAIRRFTASIGVALNDLVVPGLTLVVLATLDHVTSPNMSPTTAVQVVRSSSNAAVAAEMNPATVGTATAEDALEAVRRHLDEIAVKTATNDEVDHSMSNACSSVDVSECE